MRTWADFGPYALAVAIGAAASTAPVVVLANRLQPERHAACHRHCDPDEESAEQDKPSGPLPPADTSPPEFPPGPGGAPLTSIDIPVEEDGGTFVTPVGINHTLSLKFVVDSGSSDVSLPFDVISVLHRTGGLVEDDYLGAQDYELADGSTSTSHVVRIRELTLGGVRLKNVSASVSEAAATPLLGQSFLNRFASWSLDNQRHVLVLKATAPRT